MFRKLIIAVITNLLILTSGFADEGRVLQLLNIAKDNNVSDAQVAAAIANDSTPAEFITQIMGRIRLIGPEAAPKGSPVQISVEGLPGKAAELWRRHPTSPTDVWLQLYDKDQRPVNIFWSQTDGVRVFELIVAENSPDSVPTLEIATYTLSYGNIDVIPPGPGPVIVIPEPSQELQKLVEPLTLLHIDEADMVNLTAFYFDFASVIRRDNAEVISTTAIFRSTYMDAGGLMFQQTGMTSPDGKKKYAGLSEIVDGIIMEYIKADVAALDVERTSSILQAIAWSFSRRAIEVSSKEGGN